MLMRYQDGLSSHLGGINSDVQSDLAILAFRNGEQLEYFSSRILRLQQEIILSGGIFSTTIINVSNNTLD